MTIGLTWRRTARRIKRLKEAVLTISSDYSDRLTLDFLAFSNYRYILGRQEADFQDAPSLLGPRIELCSGP